jgi:hypothetical protein
MDKENKTGNSIPAIKQAHRKGINEKGDTP